MTITARFDSRCPACGGQIEAGERVEWSKGSKARHIDCQRTAAVVRAEREAEWVAEIRARNAREQAEFEAAGLAGQWGCFMTPHTIDSMSEAYRQQRTAVHWYEDEATARAHKALNEGWDGEYHIRERKVEDVANSERVALITYAELEPALRAAHLI